MKSKISYIVIIAAVLLAGCSGVKVKSLQPFYTDETLVQNHSLEGDWLIDTNDTTSIMRITKIAYNRDSTHKVAAYKVQMINISRKYSATTPKKGSKLKYHNGHYFIYTKSKKISKEEKPESYLTHLFLLKNGSYYLDITLFNDAYDHDFTIPVHNVAKLSIFKNTMIYYGTSDDFFGKSLREKMVKIPMQDIGTLSSSNQYTKDVVVTASSSKLQKFVLKYDKQLFDSSSFQFPLRRIIIR